MVVSPYLCALLFSGLIKMVASTTAEPMETCPEGRCSSPLRPIVSESRKLLMLDHGIWKIKFAREFDPDEGFRNRWYSQPFDQGNAGEVYRVPVPANFPELKSSDIESRGNGFPRLYPTWTWYQTQFKLPRSWGGRRRQQEKRQNDQTLMFLRVGAAHYSAIVYVNGQRIGDHAGGSIPFVFQVPEELLKFEDGGGAGQGRRDDNLLTIAVNDTLTDDTIPQGRWSQRAIKRRSYGGVRQQAPQYYWWNVSQLETEREFLGYAGIHDSVTLYTTPTTRIHDVNITTDYKEGNGYVNYSVVAMRGKSLCHTGCSFLVQLYEKDDRIVSTDSNSFQGDKTARREGSLRVEQPQLWWPFTMVPENDPVGYLYTLKITLTDEDSGGRDVYTLQVGIRTLTLGNNSTKRAGSQIRINEKPFYFTGIDCEEFLNDVRDLAEITGDMTMTKWELYRWLRANSVRTGRKPLREDMMDKADQLGIVVINEVPAVNLKYFGHSLLEQHKKLVQDLVQRDKNRPSVVMWSLASFSTAAEKPIKNGSEAGDDGDNSIRDAYFRELTNFARRIDPQRRPLAAEVRELEIHSDRISAKYLDIVLLSWHKVRRTSWEVPQMEIPLDSVMRDIENWRRWVKNDLGIVRKPILVSEYGVYEDREAPTGICDMPGQSDPTFESFHGLFNRLREAGALVGEMNWSCDHRRVSPALHNEHYAFGLRCRNMGLTMLRSSSNYSEVAAAVRECWAQMKRAGTTTTTPCPYSSWFLQFMK